MKWILPGLLSFIVFSFILATPVLAVSAGVQLPSSQPVSRLVPNRFDWIKYQYSLGSAQPLETWISTAKSQGYRVLISAAKNGIGIPELVDPPKKPCPYEEELETYPIYDNKGNIIGWEKEPMPPYNGYMKYRDEMTKFAQRVGNRVDAIELWNEPNLNV
ncbi:MAG: hypothetical protein V1808_02250, partial [Candidatus Daviesbacteria bacterium]